MVTTLDKFDIDSVSKYLYELMRHIHEKSEGNIEMVFIVASNKDKKVNHIIPAGKEAAAKSVILLTRSLGKLIERYPDLIRKNKKLQL